MAIINYAEAWIDQYANQLPTVNFVSGDYTSLKESIRQYVVNQCPEDYNDWANSSEVGIFVNGLSYLGSIINYRVDLNAHDIFPSTTERRQSLLNFVKMLSYSPKRNIAALGIAKIVSIRTNETIYDSFGNSLRDVDINWNDTVNPNWQEQFMIILNNAFSSTNPFGKPLKKMTYNGITTQLYEINDLRNDDCIYPFTAVVNGSVKQFEVVNADLDTDLMRIDEKDPVPEQAFNILYRTDGTGNSSANTGFFVYWKQGSLKNQIIQFSERIENNVLEIDETNINNYDVWFQSLDTDTGLVKENWVKIPDNEYLVYNSLDNEVRNIYRVETKDEDKAVLRFSDGKFGTIPVGYFRVWYRISGGNNDMYIQPADIRNVSVNIPYRSVNSADTNDYYLTLEFSISDYSHITQSVAQETMNYIRERAPQVYSTQNRMVTGSDYNYFPKSSTQRIRLIKAIERTYSGNTRYIDFNDPTGKYKNVQLLADDGYLYDNEGITSVEIPNEDWTTEEELIALLSKELRKISLSNFYYKKYKTKDLYYQYNTASKFPYIWKELENYGTNSSIGYFTYSEGASIPYYDVSTHLKVGSLIKMVAVDGETWNHNELPTEEQIIDESWITIGSMKENKLFDDGDDHTQNIIINDSLNLNYTWVVYEYYEPFNITIEDDLKTSIYNLFKENTSFGLRYNTELDILEIMGYNSLCENDVEWEEQEEAVDTDKGCTDWIIKVNYNSSNIWEFQTRYVDYIFGSANDMSFYFNTSIKNNDGTFFTEDYIKVLKHQSNELLNLRHDYYWKPCNVIIYSDGYTEPNKFKAYGYDADKDTTIDNPMQFKEICDESSQKLFFGVDNNHDYSILYDNVVELNTMWDSIEDGEFKDFSATNVSNMYYLRVPCTVYPAGTIIPFRKADEEGNVEPITIYATSNVRLSDGRILYASEKTPVEIAVSGQKYNYDVVDVGHTIDYEYDDDGNIVIIDDKEAEFEYASSLREIGDKVYVCVKKSGANRYKVYKETPTLIYWSSGENNMEIIPESDFTIKKGVRDIIFMWKHFATTKYLIDPSTTNIIDMYVLTSDYWNDVQTWINAGKKATFPKLPSEYQLRSLFADLENYKMLSDTMIWHSISFKLLFGSSANEELRGVFKVIKNENTILSDNEIKQEVIKCIDEFFSYMEPGETFFFTQLSSYIHNRLGQNIGTVLLVPTYNDGKFGNLFEIKCDPDEILLSSATINDIQIISKITDYNIRISQ